jgi:REP element-mobilizing transposase RayT
VTRSLRIEYEGALCHVTSRGVARRGIFLDVDDNESLLVTLQEAVSRCQWLRHTDCLMPNHYHLLLETPEANLARGMQWLNGVSSQRFHRRHARVGHAFQGRYQGISVEKESQLLVLARYVVVNPVHAGLFRSPGSWPWSSCGATAGVREAPGFRSADWLLAQFGSSRCAARDGYRRFVSEEQGGDVGGELHGGCLLGSQAFIRSLRPLLQDVPPEPNLLRKERVAARPTLKVLFDGVHDRQDSVLEGQAFIFESD